MESKFELRTNNSNLDDSLLESIFNGIEEFLEENYPHLNIEINSFKFYIHSKLKNTALSSPENRIKLIRIIENFIQMQTGLNTLLRLQIHQNIQGKLELEISEQDKKPLDNQVLISLYLLCESIALEGEIKKGEIYYFKPITNDGLDQNMRNGSCGYLSLGTSREVVLKDLQNAVDEKKISITQKISNQIYQDYISGDGLSLSYKWKIRIKNIIEQINTQENTLAEIEGALKKQQENILIETNDTDLPGLKADILEEIKVLMNKLTLLLNTPDLIKDYLIRNIPSEWMSVGIAQAWAEATNIKLCIWREKGGNRLYLLDDLTFIPKESLQTIHMRQTNNEQHFERLEVLSKEELSYACQYRFPSERWNNEKNLKASKKELMDFEYTDESHEGITQTTLKELLEKLKQGEPDSFSIFWGNEAFKKPKEEVEPTKNKLSTTYKQIYGNAEYCAKYDVKNPTKQESVDFQKQFGTLLVKLEKSILIHKWIEPEEIKEIKEIFKLLTDNFFHPDFAGKQTNLYFETIKNMLEDMTLVFLDDTKDMTQKKNLLSELKSALGVCGPGLYTKLDIAYRTLKRKNTLLDWLADFRETLIIEYTEEYTSNKKQNEIQSVHVMNAFKTYAINVGWNPAGNKCILTDDFWKSSQLTAQDIIDFHHWFLRKYNPSNIIANIGTSLIPILKEVEKTHGDDYVKLCEELQIHLNHVGVDATKCMRMKADSENYEIDYQKLKHELIYGLITKDVFSNKVKNIFQTYSVTSTDTLVYCDPFPDLSHVQQDGNYVFIDSYLPQLVSNPVLPNLMTQLLNNHATTLVILLLLNEKISEDDKLNANKYLDTAFKDGDSLLRFIELMTKAQKKLFFKSNFFTSERMVNTITSWEMVKKLFSNVWDTHEDCVKCLFEQVLSRDNVKRLCALTEDRNPTTSIRSISDGLPRALRFTFMDRVYGQVEASTIGTGPMFITVFKPPYFSQEIKKMSPERLKQLFGTRSSMEYLLHYVEVGSVEEFLFEVDRKDKSFWNEELVGIFYQYVQKENLNIPEALYESILNYVRKLKMARAQVIPNTQPVQPVVETLDSKVEKMTQSIVDKKTFVNVISSLSEEKMVRLLLKKLFEKIQKENATNLNFLKPKKGVQSITVAHVLGFFLKIEQKEIKDLFESEKVYDKTILFLKLMAHGGFDKNLNKLRKQHSELFKRIFSQSDNLNFTLNVYGNMFSNHEFLRLLLGSGILIPAIMHSNEHAPMEWLCKYLPRSSVVNRFNVLMDILKVLTIEQRKTLLPDFNAVKQLLTIWNENISGEPLLIQVCRKDVLDWILDNNIIAPAELLKGVQSYENTVFLTDKLFKELIQKITKVIEDKVEKEKSKSPVSQLSIFKRKGSSEEDSVSKKRKDDNVPRK